jgi:hypothetical protein
MNLRALYRQEELLQGMGETLASECRLDSIALPAGEKALQLRGYSKQPARILIDCGTSTDFLSKSFAQWVGV